jgi:hypothetical protein
MCDTQGPRGGGMYSVSIQEKDFDSRGGRSDDFGNVVLDGFDYVHSSLYAMMPSWTL